MRAPELLLLRPTEGELPPADVEAQLASMPFSLRDASGLFLLCGDAHGTQFARMRLLTEPDEPMPPAALVRVSAQEVQLWQRCTDEALGQAREFAEWMRSTYACRITDPEGRDYTESLDAAYR